MISCAGLLIAGHHVWLHYLPEAEMSALPSVPAAQLQALPLPDLLTLGIFGNSECVHAAYFIFGLDVPEWFLVFFLLFAILCLWQQHGKKL
jgi:disulfide bond formation protein DsbB